MFSDSSSSFVSPKQVRKDFQNGWTDVDGVLENYKTWLSWVFYVILYRFNYSSGLYERAFFRGVKRGDEKYSYVTCRKFNKLKQIGKDLTFYKHGSHGNVKSSCLLTTIEYNSNQISLVDSWLQVGSDLNRFLSYLRKKYGKISVVRVFEAHESGYPHIHLLILFHEHSFDGKRMCNKRGNWQYRVIGDDFNSLKKSWIHGYSDFECVDSFGGGISYLSKYLTKSTSLKESGSKGAKTLAMCWVFRKRSYSISGELFADEINLLSNSNSERKPEYYIIVVGVDLFGNPITEKVQRWHLFGFCVRFGVKWADWRMHQVSGRELVLVNPKDDVTWGHKPHYKLLDGGIYI